MNSRYLFFTGKGGVGKTSVACATAINLAKGGKKVLLVSTDPASNLDDVLERRVGQKPTAIEEVPGLWALNLDPEEAARDYREQVVGAYRGVLPDSVVASMEEQLSGACTVEIAAFDLFSNLLADPEASAGYDHVVFDTAPTGHTLRLLSLPKAWSGFLGENLHGTSCVGPLAGLQEKRNHYAKALSALNDAGKTTLILVTRPETSALAEAARTARELGGLGLTNHELVVNGALTTKGEDRAAGVLKEQQAKALAEMPAELKNIPQRTVALLPVAPVGVTRLELLAEELRKPGPGSTVERMAITRAEIAESSSKGAAAFCKIPAGLRPLVRELGKKEKGIVLVMGKGGVGKTTIAAATALALFDQGHRVHLSTTDPAAHLGMVLEEAGKALGERFSVSRIDPAVEVAAYCREIMSTVGAEMDKEGRELLAEDLASPCTEETAVFRALAATVNKVEEGFVVLDTAPTGHTLLLLDNTLSYHREVERNSGELPKEVKKLLPRLRDPELTDVIIVTLPQATPVLEASRLQDDLRRARINPSWWVVNQTWTGISTNDPVLRSLSLAEAPWLELVVKTLSVKGQAVRIPWQEQEPKGPKDLRQLL